MSDVELIGVVDTKPGRADEIAAKHGTRAFASAGALVGHVDAVTVAVPTVSHVDVALPFLERGVAVLVEKPLASSVADADRLIETAARHGATLAAGHTERFNPAVVAALPLVSDPRFIEVHRLGTFPERSLDIDVVFDLMIHDLDLLLAAVRSEVVSIEAVGVNVLTPRTDIANARLRFATGCIANVTASRISRDRIRKVRFFQHDSYVSIDYASQEVEVYRLAPQLSAGAGAGPSRGDVSKGRPVIQGGKLDVVNDEPLKRELADFVDAVRTRREPGVSGRAGRDALALATRIAEKMEAAL
jgi:predicted dehydrogenase